MNLLFDTLFLISQKDDNIKLRVPLCCLLDYKGFRCLAISNIPITNDYPPALGLNTDQIGSDKNYQTEPNVIRMLSKVGKILNLKDNKCKFINQNYHENVPISISIQVYISQKL